MQTLFLSLLLICVSFQAEAQKKPSPKVKSKSTENAKGLPLLVEAAFKNSYPLVTKVKWVKKDADYEAQYEEKAIQHRIIYSSKGKLLYTAVTISIAALPHSITAYAAINYPEFQIKEALKMKSPANVISYELSVDDTYLIFDDNGNFVNRKTRSDKPIIQ